MDFNTNGPSHNSYQRFYVSYRIPTWLRLNSQENISVRCYKLCLEKIPAATTYHGKKETNHVIIAESSSQDLLITDLVFKTFCPSLKWIRMTSYHSRRLESYVRWWSQSNGLPWEFQYRYQPNNKVMVARHRLAHFKLSIKSTDL